MKDIVLLITGCINPIPNQPYLVLTDPTVRYNQYIQSIQFYLEESSFSKIVFCDNSNTHYCVESQLREMAVERGKLFEWISFQGDNTKIETQGKGYGEGELIDYALQHSELLQNCKVFAKVTGRLIIRNVNTILAGICQKKNKGNYFNRDIYRPYGLDTRFFFVNKTFYISHLKDQYHSVSIEKQNCAIEDLFFRAIQKRDYKSLPFYPRFEGTSGGNGRDYGQESKWKLNIFDILCKNGVFNVIYGCYKEVINKLFY